MANVREKVQRSDHNCVKELVSKRPISEMFGIILRPMQHTALVVFKLMKDVFINRYRGIFEK